MEHAGGAQAPSQPLRGLEPSNWAHLATCAACRCLHDGSTAETSSTMASATRVRSPDRSRRAQCARRRERCALISHTPRPLLMACVEATHISLEPHLTAACLLVCLLSHSSMSTLHQVCLLHALTVSGERRHRPTDAFASRHRRGRACGRSRYRAAAVLVGGAEGCAAHPRVRTTRAHCMLPGACSRSGYGQLGARTSARACAPAGRSPCECKCSRVACSLSVGVPSLAVSFISVILRV